MSASFTSVKPGVVPSEDSFRAPAMFLVVPVPALSHC